MNKNFFYQWIQNKLFAWEDVIFLRQIIQLKMKKKPKTQKLNKNYKGTCSFCGGNKSQTFTK